MSDSDREVASSIWQYMQKPGMDKAMILFAVSDSQLPFGQLRIRSAYTGDDARLRSAYAVLGEGRRAASLHIGVGFEQADDLLPAEVYALPRVLSNAATAIEVWLAEADLGLVMRFVNRPELYEMPRGWAREQLLEAPSAPSENASAEAVAPSAEAQNVGALIGPAPGDQFALFDLQRDSESQAPLVTLAPMSPDTAFAALAERPPSCQAVMVAGRRFSSIEQLTKDVVSTVLNHKPGMHLRLANDEDTMKTLLQYHPDRDRLLEDLVAIKIDVSPLDDDIRCLWVIKYDGYEEDVSLKTCFQGLQDWVDLRPPSPGRALPGGNTAMSTFRLGPGRWTRGLKETLVERARMEEAASVENLW